jgi:hypothetical protein
VMSMAILAPPVGTRRSVGLEPGAPVQIGNCSSSESLRRYSHTRSARTKLYFDCTITYQKGRRCYFRTGVAVAPHCLPSAGTCLEIALAKLTNVHFGPHDGAKSYV